MKKIDTEAIKARTNIIEVIDRRVPLHKKGGEFHGICPFHDDHKDSLQVNEQKQVFKCFACGIGGDSFEFLLKLGIPFVEAAEEINGGPLSENTEFEQRPTKKRVAAPVWTYIPNPPQDKPIINHYQHGEPNKVWPYHNANGDVVSYVCRFDLGEGEKIVLPYSYGNDETTTKWFWKGIPENRPLYNLHLIKQNPTAAIIIVEGEKTADAGQSQLDPEKSVVTCWIGGANGIKKTDFTPLNGRNIILFPDNDTAGESAMININEIIKETANVFGIVKNTDDKPKKWDCADKTDWKPNELRSYILGNKIDVPPLPEPVEIKPKKIEPKPEPVEIIKSPKNPPLPPRPASTYGQNEHFRFLGYLKDEKESINHYFYSFRAKMVVRFTSSGFSASTMQQIAPLNYWEDTFQKSGPGFDVKAAEAYLVGNSFNMKTFIDDKIRGRGAWIDNGKLIIHSGYSVLSDGKQYDLNEFESNFCYEMAKPLGFGHGTPLTSDKSIMINELLLKLNWDRPANAILLAGWCVVAPFCGVLEWRSHIWLTGPAGSGKSWTMANVVRKLMGETGISVVGKTTEAGIRQSLKTDAMPILFDESDIDDQKDADRIQSVLGLARSSSSSEGGDILQGSQGGTAKTYNIRSMFALSSIGVHLSQKSDLSRFTILGFKPNDLELSKNFEDLSKQWSNLVTTDFVHDLQARTLKLMPIILENIKIIKKVAAEEIGGIRIGDQVATMLAGSWSLESDGLISKAEAINFVTSMDWTDEKGSEANNDEIQLFVTIISTKLRVETEIGSVIERSVGELILIAASKVSTIKITPTGATEILKRNGIIVKDDRIYIANSAPEIKNMIKLTSWKNNHSKVLERLTGAIKETPRQFTPGVNSRSISLPIEILTDKTEFTTPTPAPENYTSATNENLINARDGEDMPF